MLEKLSSPFLASFAVPFTKQTSQDEQQHEKAKHQSPIQRSQTCQNYTLHIILARFRMLSSQPRLRLGALPGH